MPGNFPLPGPPCWRKPAWGGISGHLPALGGGKAKAQPPAEDPKEDRGQRPQEEGGLLLVRVEGVDH